MKFRTYSADLPGKPPPVAGELHNWALFPLLNFFSRPSFDQGLLLLADGIVEIEKIDNSGEGSGRKTSLDSSSIGG